MREALLGTLFLKNTERTVSTVNDLNSSVIFEVPKNCPIKWKSKNVFVLALILIQITGQSESQRNIYLDRRRKRDLGGLCSALLDSEHEQCCETNGLMVENDQSAGLETCYLKKKANSPVNSQEKTEPIYRPKSILADLPAR